MGRRKTVKKEGEKGERRRSGRRGYARKKMKNGFRRQVKRMDRVDLYSISNSVSILISNLFSHCVEDFRGVERVVRIGLWCMQNQPFFRPSVGEVMKVLDDTLSVDRSPSSFAYRNEDDTGKKVADVGAEIESGS
ncbi:hypothetical protein L6452_34319 [Arctium lappa]|uniref:Uncharacterized protein n=1 Tax=Arctium lappa TaxID=4217 RepID=A0ACB8YI10_ARCLA|nr:hypothetical protein L6452_34319 [Arctium lappa]